MPQYSFKDKHSEEQKEKLIIFHRNVISDNTSLDKNVLEEGYCTSSCCGVYLGAWFGGLGLVLFACLLTCKVCSCVILISLKWILYYLLFNFAMSDNVIYNLTFLQQVKFEELPISWFEARPNTCALQGLQGASNSTDLHC